MRPGTIKVHIVLWATLMTGVVATGLYWIPREYPTLSFWECLYSIIRLFVFERDLPSFPKSWPIIAIHFAAPLITVSALGTVLSYLLKSTSLRIRLLGDHVIICGAGRTGKLIAASLRGEGIPVVLIDRGAPEGFTDWIKAHGAHLVTGDFHSRDLLEKCGIARCRSIIFASGDDLANIEGAICASEALQDETGPERIIWTHVAEDRLAATMQHAIRTSGPARIRYFDTYDIAAGYMMRDCVSEELIRDTATFTIIGFGKFGTDLLEKLAQRLARKKKYRIDIIDRRDVSVGVRSLAQRLGIGRHVRFRRVDIKTIDSLGGRGNICFLCTDDDLGNLTLAMNLSERSGAAYIFVRMAYWPMKSVTEHIGEERGIVFVNINDLIDRGVRLLMGKPSPGDGRDA